ncbi:MAG TPA: ABC transporter substrate-binding protein [Saprospiraceae bacterium]|nr:ABC transporter substrate-binding protein [Saprospiraceae bacterium]
MKNISLVLVLALSLLACTNETSESTTDQPQSYRIISLSGFLTEVLFDLGYGGQIVATDVTSSYPAATGDIPKLGHITQLNAEAILEMQPDYIFLEENQLNQTEVLSALELSGIKIVPVATSHQLSNAIQAGLQIQQYLDTPQAALEQMRSRITRDSLQLVKMLEKVEDPARVLFIYARGAGRLMVGGRGTSAEAMIKLAGAENAITAFADFKPLTPEALLEAAPEVILMFSTGLESLDGKEGLAQITGIPQTTAFQNDRIIAMDGHYLTAFGPRAGAAALELAQRLYP